MKSINLKFILLFATFFLVCSFCALRNTGITGDVNVSNCDSVNKIESLIQEIVSRPYLYMLSPNDTSKDTYLIANQFVKPGKVYVGPFDRLVITEERKDINMHFISVLIVKKTEFNSDTTKAHIEIEHSSNNRINTGAKFCLSFDTTYCKWIVTDSVYFVH